jgi:signal recognition particle subunit SRP54
MLPGAGQMKEQLKQVDDRDLDRTAAIIRSMTPAERVTPKIINASRRVRIANGSGVSVTDVNQLLERFGQAQKMMGQMAGSMGLPGMGPMSKKARGRQMQAQARGKNAKKGKGKAKGGPARRAIGAPGGTPGGGFPGLPGGGMPGGGVPGGLPGLPPGQGLPDLTKLRFDTPGDDRPGR